MSTTPEQVLSIVPELRPTPTGWLAVSADGSPLRIGVIAATEAEARIRFAAALESWAQLRSLPDPYVP